MPHKSLNYALSVNGGEYSEPQNLGDNKSYIYVGGSLDVGESDIVNLKLWVNEEFGTYANGKFLKSSIELILYSEMPTRNYIIYDLGETEGFISKTSVSSKRVTSEKPARKGYSFVGWSTVMNSNEVEYEPGAIYDKNVGCTLYPVLGKELLYEKVSTSLSEVLVLDEDVNFVVGTKEEVWYSGKLWRIVSLYNDGKMKLITDKNMTTISWEGTCSSVDYSTSIVRKWLNNVFLNTLENHEEIIVESVWDYTPSSNTNVVKPNMSNYVRDKVGMLNLYEYSMAGNNSYLNNNNIWWVLTSAVNAGSSIWEIATDGVPYSFVSCDTRGIRPSIVLSKDVIFDGGTGSYDDPYHIYSDKEMAKLNDKLNSRISGEYIKFNNNIYRIIGTELINGNLMTKITLMDYSLNRNTLATNEAYASVNDNKVFNTTNGIGKFLNDWYNNLNTDYKNLIATSSDGVKWYSGPTNGVYRDYALSKTGDEISATIGLPYYGEMFASHGGQGYFESTSFWTMTRYNDSVIWVISDYDTGSGFELTSTTGVRPTLYLKSSVIIKDANGDGDYGNGTKIKPYEIG